ncbi:MAG: biopolymer transporter ExbD [Alphaproteobacteria bacterium]|nr:biopolymer transporter ExbD [Alphaproteobacteria bacterium]
MIDFRHTKRHGMRGLPLTPLIDVVFILIIFFMLTTSFMRVESLELILPSKGGKAAERQEVVRLYLYANGELQLGKRKLDNEELGAALAQMFEKDPATKMMVLTGKDVTMQQMVAAMDRIYEAGGQSIFVRKWVGGR